MCFAAFLACVPNMKAAQAGADYGAIDSQATKRVGSDAPDCRSETSAIAASRVFAVQLFASAQYSGNVGLCGVGNPIPRHFQSRRRRDSEIVEEAVQLIILEFGEFTAIERCDTLSDSNGKPFTAQGVFLATTPQCVQSVGDNIAGVLVFTASQHLIDKRVLLGREAYAANRHRHQPSIAARKQYRGRRKASTRVTSPQPPFRNPSGRGIEMML
jgi:hypothetical protein